MIRNVVAISVFTGILTAQSAPNTGMADPATFQRLYEQRLAAQGNSAMVSLPLIAIGGISAEGANAVGQVRVNLTTGAVTSRVAGLAAGDWELHLVDNGPGTTLPDSGDRLISAGRYQARSGEWVVETRVELPAGFEIDRAVVTRAGADPASGFALIGAADIYQRLSRGWVRIPEGGEERRVNDGDSLTRLIARGRALFLRERFQGNGRTCGTCHIESNNFTIDAAAIASLPPSDPLFVHEQNPDLAKNFESPAFLRRLGLFVANADGLDDLANKFTLRPASSLLALGTQSTAPEPVFFADFSAVGQALNPPERVGWGNDNLPVRDFAIGAILQHMTRTLNRKPVTDFRIPNDGELDALAAFQLSLGRAEDFDLKKLRVLPSQAATGQKLYMDTGKIGEPGHKNCNACHFNGGGTTAFGLNPDAPGFSPVLDAAPRGFNGTIGTNVNGLPASLLLNLPPDGGFGAIPIPGGSFGNFGEIPGVGVIPVEEFTSNSVVESADTAPYFHNHAVATLEEAVAFYGSDAYQSPVSIGDKVAGPVPVKINPDPKDPEVQAISTFLRVLNTLENIRSAISLAQRAQGADPADARELATLGREEVIDAIEVMSSGSLAQSGDFGVVICRTRLTGARNAFQSARTANDRRAIEDAMNSAIALLRGARETLVDASTLPESFRN